VEADPAEDGGPAGRFRSGVADFIRITPDLARDGPTARRHERLATLHVTVNHTDEQNIDSALHTIFARILQFHQVHNTAENYRKLSSSRYGSVSDRVWFIKWLLTFNVVLMLYGIWFGIHP